MQFQESGKLNPFDLLTCQLKIDELCLLKLWVKVKVPLKRQEKRNKWFTDKTGSLGTSSFCFVSCSPWERSVPQQAQSVPQTMLDTRQTGASPGSSYHAEFLHVAYGHTQKADPGYHSLPGKDQSCYLSSLSSWAILLSPALYNQWQWNLPGKKKKKKQSTGQRKLNILCWGKT